MRAAHPHVWDRFIHLIDTHDLNIDQLTYEEANQWIFKAERQPSDKSAILALANSRYHEQTLHVPDTHAHPSRSNTPAANPAPTQHTHQDGVPAVYIPQGKDPHAKVFEGLCGPAVTVTQQVRDQAARDGKRM